MPMGSSASAESSFIIHSCVEALLVKQQRDLMQDYFNHGDLAFFGIDTTKPIHSLAFCIEK
jgi:hypothetical protein